MDLSHYWRILRRRWWLAVLPALVVLLYSVSSYSPPAQVFTVGLRFTVGYPPETTGTYLYDKYYPAWLASEYIAGGLRDWAVTGDFAAAVDEELGRRGVALGRSVAGAFASDHQRSVTVLYITWNDAAQLESIAQAAITVMQTRNAQAFPQLGTGGATVRAVDAPAVGRVPAGLRAQLDLPLRLALGLALGLALAFVAHYLDPAVRDRAELEAMGYTVVGEVPKTLKSKT
ncbi:MAG: hypothetical protein JW850_07045 [Thermoflexales bacterium]|nr:hypothetical protein [Thermoflexales bacterium]